MLVHSCSYKNSCFIRPGVQLQCPYANGLHEDALKDLALDLVGTFSFEGLLYFVYSFG